MTARKRLEASWGILVRVTGICWLVITIWQSFSCRLPAWWANRIWVSYCMYVTKALQLHLGHQDTVEPGTRPTWPSPSLQTKRKQTQTMQYKHYDIQRSNQQWLSIRIVVIVGSLIRDQNFQHILNDFFNSTATQQYMEFNCSNHSANYPRTRSPAMKKYSMTSSLHET